MSVRDREGEPQEPQDLRMPLLGAVGWLGSLLGLLVTGWVACVVVTGVLAAVGWGWWRRPLMRTTLSGCCVVLVAAVAVGTLAGRGRAVGIVPALADEGAVISATVQVSSDPKVKEGRFEDFVILRGTVVQVAGRGGAWQTEAPIVLFAPTSWRDTRLGCLVDVSGRLRAADGERGPPGAEVAVLTVRGEPRLREPPDLWWSASAVLRAGIRAAVAGQEPDRAALVPALVDGDDGAIPEDLADDFRSTGLTHLLAVSGTNLTLIVGFLIVLARWMGVRRRGIHLVAVIGIVGFVLLARTEPSVVRAAAMGTVGLLAMGSNGRQRGARALGVSVLVLVLFDPWLAVSAGFALSVLATAGILFLAPGWRDALAGWLPRWMAEAIAVPAAAQLACTPVVAVLSGQVSLIAVAANLLAAPAVAPATVLGLAGGAMAVGWEWAGRLIAAPAAWSVGWIISVARHGARLDHATIEWSTQPWAIGILVVLCLLMVPLLPRMLARPLATTSCFGVGIAVMVCGLPTPGWPPPDWQIAACDVGQGDATVVRTGPHEGVLFDAGPDSTAIDRCLRGLEITALPLIVLTHFHADHVDGLPGAMSGREVGAIAVTPYSQPAEAATWVRELAAAAGVPVQEATHATTLAIGVAVLQFLGPEPETLSRLAGVDSGRSTNGEGSAPNNASIVVLVQTGQVRAMITGDIEPEAQRDLARSWPGVDIDVLKVPHHGSRHQDPAYLTDLRPEVALISVGADNDYGHPADDTVSLLNRVGAQVWRTDVAGDLVVVEESGEVVVRTGN